MRTLPAGYRLSFDPDDADPVAAHAYLTRSYWAPGIPLDTVERSMRHSLCCTIHHAGAQIAMARVISDYATFAYLADVYVLEDHRGRGLSRAMLVHLDDHPQLQGLRRWALFTLDAQGLYRQHGWSQYPHPERMMIRDNPDIYR